MSNNIKGFKFENSETIYYVLPSVDSSDAGKFLRVSSEGEWGAESLTDAEEEEF